MRRPKGGPEPRAGDRLGGGTPGVSLGARARPSRAAERYGSEKGGKAAWSGYPIKVRIAHLREEAAAFSSYETCRLCDSNRANFFSRRSRPPLDGSCAPLYFDLHADKAPFPES
ncbi:hypothetical protein KM043_006121 [Ampulex compressa]|nr:hypothetical protein KM043_006121 [Ampulex compressa]